MMLGAAASSSPPGSKLPESLLKTLLGGSRIRHSGFDPALQWGLRRKEARIEQY